MYNDACWVMLGHPSESKLVVVDIRLVPRKVLNRNMPGHSRIKPKEW